MPVSPYRNCNAKILANLKSYVIKSTCMLCRHSEAEDSSCWVEHNLSISGVQYGNQVGKRSHDLTVALKTSICWITDMSFIKPLFTNLPSYSNIKFSLIIQRLDVLSKSVSYFILLTQCCISGVTRQEIRKVW